MVMRNLKRRTVGVFFSAAAGLALFAAPAVVMGAQGADNPQPVAQRCYNGVTLLNPWAQSCTIPGPTNKIRGSAPDANAIIACRGIPGCLSWYVNNP
ncbi:MAG: hypothetical protein QOD39_4560 [Mycobacterium sp.]|jgi:hypothetical protein|nr:hypothetical protein [Mycobacterium sp.]